MTKTTIGRVLALVLIVGLVLADTSAAAATHVASRMYPVPQEAQIVVQGIASYPFCDDVESGTGNWTAETPWGVTDQYAHSGSYSWTDSPGTSYENSVNTALTFAINLGSATMPVLSFWHRYAFEANADWGFVDVSTDGGASWTTVYFVTGQSVNWKYEKIDLSGCASMSGVRIRFRVKSNESGRYDGWYLDDICIGEATGSISYPFLDDMEGGATTEDNWQSSSFELVPLGHSGTYCWHDSPEGVTTNTTLSCLTLADTIDLTAAVNPQLTFWEHHDVCWGGYLRVEVSDSYGQPGTWAMLGQYDGTQASWVQQQVDLSDYVGLPNVRVRFSHYEQNGSCDGVYIDDVRIEDAPPDVILNPLSNVTMHGADLDWTESGDPDFARYLIYRHTNSSVSRACTLIALIEDRASTTFHDTYCLLEPTRYHYIVYVQDINGVYSRGSNVQQTLYTVPVSGYPFCDDMESGTGNWEWSSPWGVTDHYAHSGSYSWTDSPGTKSAGGAKQ